MSGLGLFLSGDLDALVERYVADQTETPNPLVRHTVVVPNSAVGQWFEQAVARRTGRDGGADGVVANVDTIFPRGLIGRVLYGEPHVLDRWSVAALAVGLMDDDRESPISMSDALARGAVLERVITHRADELDELLAGPSLGRERRLLERRKDAGELWPAAQLAHFGITRPDLVGPEVAFIGSVTSFPSGLLCDVARALSEQLQVDLYLAVASRELTEPMAPLEPEDLSLMQRWGGTTRAHLEQWRTRAAPGTETWIDAPAVRGRDAALRVLAGPSDGVARSRAPFLEVHRAVGVARQVEVARDALLRALSETGLAPHQVRIVTPDATRVAPILSQFFQRDDDFDSTAPRLQFEVADPQVVRASPRLDAFRELLGTVGGDLTVYDVTVLLGQPSLCAGLGLSRRDAQRLLDLAREGRVSLGLDGASRAQLELFEPDDDTGTWSRLVDRVVLASVFDVERNDEASDISTLGVADDLGAVSRFHALVEWLRASARDVSQPLELGAWSDVFIRWSVLLARDERARDFGLDQLLASLESLATTSHTPMTFATARDLVEALARPGGSTLVGRGGATFLDFTGSSGIPFEITCVIGLDDEALPESSRRTSGMGEDRVTDPEPRREFRAALLNLLASTHERILVVTNDRNVVDGAPLPTTLPLTELLDVLAPAGLVSDQRHPRHGHSLGRTNPDVVATTSLDPVHALVAATLGARDPARPEADVALAQLRGDDREPDSTVAARRLADYFVRPQRVFLRDVLGAAAVHAGPGEEIPDVPYLDLGGTLAEWSVKERLLRDAVENAVAPVVPSGPDSPLAGVVTGLRAAVAAEVNVSEIEHFAEHVRDSLATIEATRDPLGERPSVIQGQRHSITREPVELYRSAVGPLLVRYTSSTRFSSRVVALVIDLAVVTVETGAAVTGVLLRGRNRSEAERLGDARPFLTASWTTDDAVGAAQRLLGGLLRIYGRRFDGVPLHFGATSIAFGARHLDVGLGQVVDTPEKEWLNPGFGAGPARGESLEPENRLLIPLEYAELMEVFDGAVAAASIDLVQVLGVVSVQVHPGTTPWTTVVASMGERE
ncbi:MAG TPA: exodeoxyribonuclease V subunit gamma [Acidimicrobiales bacterium]|nr:exodeoxyribonuclease V subunit gamma [Acidimicrobiales bacterium]